MKLLYISLLIISARYLHVDAMNGGSYVEIRELPYQAQLYNTYKYGLMNYCGATIISKYWLVTAAHCVGKSTAITHQVRVGSSSAAYKGSLVNISKIVIPGDYDNVRTHDSDIALIKTKTPIEFNEYQQPIPIANESPKVGELITASGFGDAHYHILGHVLKISHLPVIDIEPCRHAYDVLITDNMFCTNSSKVDLCYGDSGSPAVLNGKLVGVASQGCEYTKPNVFTKVSNFYDWIIKQTGIKYDD